MCIHSHRLYLVAKTGLIQRRALLELGLPLDNSGNHIPINWNSCEHGYRIPSNAKIIFLL